MVQIPNGNYIVIEGNIGAGKTSLCRLLAQELGAKLILEEFSDNPFLPLFYQNPDRYAFPVELFFMTERHKQLQNLLLEPTLFQQYVVSDYVFSKTVLFAHQNLEQEEFRLFQRLFNTLNAAFPKPDLLVYLHRPVPELLQNIQQRNRSYEQNIQGAYLTKIQQAYFEFFKSQQHHLPILILEVSNMDFVNNTEHYQHILQQLQQPYKVGISHWNLS